MARKNVRKSYMNVPEEFKDLLRLSADNNQDVAFENQRIIAEITTEIIRKSIWDGDNTDRIFTPIKLEKGAAPEFYLDLIAPGTQKEYKAYAIPAHGYIPERCVSGDMVMLPTFKVANAIDWPLELAQNSRVDVVGSCLEAYQAGYVMKDNEDSWYTLLKAAQDRDVMVFDPNAGAGRLTIRLISQMKQAMTRLSGGNSSSPNRGELTDLYMSLELAEGMREWTLAEIPEMTRQEIFTSTNGFITEILGVTIHAMTEFGAGQEYQNFFLASDGLNGDIDSSDTDLIVGLDLQRADSFVNPIRQELETFPDPALHRQQRAGFYGWKNHGFGVLDPRRVLLGSA